MDKKISVEQVVEIKEQLEGTPGAQQRLGSYQALARSLGRETIESERFAYITPATTREHAPWERADDDTDLLVHIPFLHQIIEDQRTVLGAMRSYRVPLPEPGDREAQKYSDRLERGVAHMWRVWKMPVFLSEAAWYAVVFGTGVGVLRWDRKDKIPMPSIRSPENFLAQPDPDDTTRVQIGVFTRKTLGRMLNYTYRDLNLDLDPDEEYEEIDYYDNEYRCRCIKDYGKFIIEPVKNPLDHTPIYLFKSVDIPGSLFGASNLTRTIPIQNEIDRLYSRQAEYLDIVMNAPTFIKDPDEVPPNFTWNKNAVVTMGPQGAIGKAPLASIDPRMFEYRMEDMKHNLDNAMDFSAIARGEYHSQISGKGVSALKSGTQQRMMMRLQTFDPEIERMTEDGLLLWQKSGGRKAVTVYGKSNGSVFSEQFSPRDDINKDWVHVYVYLDSAAYIDRQAAQVTNLQKVRGAPQTMSVRRFLELDPDCDDVEAEMQRIQQEQMEFLQMQQQAAMGMQGGMGTAAPGAAEEAYAAERGGAVGEAAPTGGPEGVTSGPMPSASPEAPPMMGPGEEEDVLPAVADLFRSVPKIRGEVWMVGDYLEGGLTADEFAEGFIDLYVSDALDKATILNFVRKTNLAAAAEQQRLVFHEDREFLMAHPRLDVSPGSSGYELEGAGEPTPEEELPMGMSEDEEMMAMQGEEGMMMPPPGMEGGV